MEVKDKIDILQEFDHATIEKIANKPVLIVTAKDSFIPIEEFKSIFNKAGELVKQHKTKKLIFDKRNLTVFHQPSMEWYFTEWKEEMFDKGLKNHRKLLPDDKVFRQSVKLGRQKIDKDYKDLRLNEMDIKYFEELQEAIDN